MALLFILDDEVVKLSPYARAIRDVEDEELWSFSYGMSPWQGALAGIFLRGSNLITDVQGSAFVPFAQAFAAVLTAVITGSLYYIAASPKDPTYVVAPILQSQSGRQDLKKMFEAWYEKRQMRKIYSPILEGLWPSSWVSNGFKQIIFLLPLSHMAYTRPLYWGMAFGRYMTTREEIFSPTENSIFLSKYYYVEAASKNTTAQSGRNKPTKLDLDILTTDKEPVPKL